MKRFNISLPIELDKKIDHTIKRWGFTGKADFFRHLAIDFIRTDEQFQDQEESMQPHKEAIFKTQAKKRSKESITEWKKDHRYIPAE